MQKRLRLGHRGLLLVTTALMPLLVHCEVDATATPPAAYGTVQVTAPPPPPPPQGDVTVGTAPDQPTEVADTDPSALADFHAALDPYGEWVDDANYGTVWFPNRSVVGNDFTPYMTAGHWVYDNNDYLWVSDYDWGWAPFHYGRWLHTPRGWGWVPGHEYAGAWVTWRNGDDGYGYAGWAPTPPSYYWRGGVAVNVPPPEPVFVYVQTSDLFAPNVGVRVLPRARYREFEGRTRVYAPQPGGGRVVVRGPAPTHFGINMNTVPRAPANNPGLARAQEFRTRPVVRPVTPGNPGAQRPGDFHGAPAGGQAQGGVRPGEQRPGDFHGAPPQGGQAQGGVRPGEQRPGDFHGAPAGGQAQGGVRPGEQRPGDFHGAPPQGGQPQGQPGGHVSGVDNRPDVHGQAANEQHPSGAQLPPDARTRPVQPTQQQMHAAPPPTTNNNNRAAPPPRKR